MKVKQFFKNLQKEGVLLLLITVILGVMLVCFPESILTYTSYAIGVFFVVWGGYHIFRYFNKKNDYSSIDLILGIISILLSVLFFLRPEFIVSLLPKLFAVIIFIDGIVKLSSALRLNKNGYKRWWILFIFAMLMLVGGVVVFFCSFEITALILKVIGVILIVNAVMDLYKLIICKIKLASKKSDDEGNVKVKSVKTINKDAKK